MHPGGCVSYLSLGSISLLQGSVFTCLQDQPVVGLLWKTWCTLCTQMDQFPVFRINWSVTLINFLPVFRINQSVIENIIPLMYPHVDQFLTCFQDQSVCHGRDTVHLMHRQFLTCLQDQSVCCRRHGTSCAPTGGSVFFYLSSGSISLS